MTLMHQHGGDLDAIERKYGITKDNIIDFSGNINPLGFPQSVTDVLRENLQIISTYPDKHYTALRKAISVYTGACSENIVVGNGSTELISAFIKTIQPKVSVIIGPAYSEYEREVTLCGGMFSYFPLREEENFEIHLPRLLASLGADVDMLVACNPNNPTGSVITAAQLREILTHCKQKNIAVMIDETYAEFSDNLSEICAIPLTQDFDNLFVIRGTSKFFAAPGIRLGYGVSSNEAFKSRLRTNQDPWSVNSLAAFAGEYLFSDTAFHHETQSLISEERRSAFSALSTWKNIRAYPSSANFILLRLLTERITAASLFEAFIQKNMLIRDASSFAFLDQSYLRFCILSPENNANFLQELKRLVE